MAAGAFDVTKQLGFYGAYHSNRINVIIHIICVPLLLWSLQVMASELPVPSTIPHIHYKINDYMLFDLNWPAIHAIFSILYYSVLEPIAALLYVPQMAFSLLTATAYAQTSKDMTVPGLIQVGGWVAQFIGHGFAEKRAPALLDNLIGALLLAPFFVHLENLFAIGYRPEFHRAVKNEIGKEIARIQKGRGDEKRKEL